MGFFPKNFMGQKHAKLVQFWLISNFDSKYFRNKWRHSTSDKYLRAKMSKIRHDFGQLLNWLQISQEPIKISKIGNKLDRQLLGSAKNYWTLVHWRITYRCKCWPTFKLTMPRQMSLGHITLLWGEIQPSKFHLQSDLQCWVDSHWALPQISSYCCFALIALLFGYLAAQPQVFKINLLMLSC